MSAVPMNSTAASSPATVMSGFMWLIKRELWEHRKFFIAPLIVSGIYILAVIVGLARMEQQGVSVVANGIEIAKDSDKMDGELLKAVMIVGTAGATVPFFIVTFFVTFFYALDTLYADRRDRSLLFWKSLPVSDTETVASKLAISAIVAPAITLVVALLTEYVCLILVSVVMMFKGHATTQLWAQFPVFQSIVFMLYTIVVVGIWYLPVWGWFLMVSSWANRMPFLWSLVPLAALAFLEYLTLGSHRVLEFLGTRFNGVYKVALDVPKGNMEAAFQNHTAHVNVTDFLTPGKYFASTDLWIGLAIAAVFLAVTVWMRRYRTAS